MQLKCLCRQRVPNFDIPGRVGNIKIVGCTCGVRRSADDVDGVLESYLSGAYHNSTDRHPDVKPYEARYEDDYRVAKLRADRYDAFIGCVGPLVLDVGAATGAFVNYLRSEYVDAWGVEPDPRFASARVFTGTITSADLCGSDPWDLITYHDVLEHIVDPVAEVKLAAERLATHGTLVLEVPDVAVPAGLKHYKAEHLWYFTLRSLVDILEEAGLSFMGVEYPIPGKITVYGYREAR